MALALQWKKTIDGRAEGQFDSAVRESTAAVGSEFQRTEDALRGIRGLFASSDRVESPEFQAYVGSLNMEERFPSIRAIAFTSAVPTRSLAQFAAAQRRDGETGFTIFTAPQSDPSLRGSMQRRIVTYVAPPGSDAGRPGLDVTARRGPRVAHDLATDTGQAAVSPKLNLVTKGDEPGVSTALAVYRRGAPIATVAQRRAAVRSWVIARISGQRFAAGVRTPRARRLGVEIFDGAGTDERALLARVPRRLPDGTRTETRAMAAGGRTWTLRYTALAGASRTSGLEPLAVLLVGLLLSGLLAALVRTQMAAPRARRSRGLRAHRRAAPHDRRALHGQHRARGAQPRGRGVRPPPARLRRHRLARAAHALDLDPRLPRPRPRRPPRGPARRGARLPADRLPSGQRLLAIVGDLLTVDKTDAGAMEIRRVDTTMEALLAPTVETFGAACRTKGLT